MLIFPSTLLFIYIALCVLLYFMQEKIIFFPNKLEKTHQFAFDMSYDQQFEEIFIPTKDDIDLHGLLFKSAQDTSKGLVFYLHGNAGSLEHWGQIAPVYTNLGYDIFILDYRGFGKSQGKVISEKQFFTDAQLAYDVMKKQYVENQIHIIGYSIGTGTAAYLASKNNPQQLILKAPYYSLVDMTKKRFPFIPAFLLKYDFETHQYITQTQVPITLFHGDQDEVIYYGSSQKLSTLLKKSDQFITLEDHPHNGLNYSPVFQKYLKELLP